MKRLLLEVEVTTPSNQMDLDQEIQVINPKDKNVCPEERHKWRIPELPPVPKGNNRDIPVSVQELVYGSKTERVGTSPNTLDRHHELISSSEEGNGARKYRGTSEWLDTHVLQRTSPKDKILVEKPEHVIRIPEKEIGPRKVKKAQWKLPKPSQAKICLNKCQTSPGKPQRPTRRERESPSGTSLTLRITEFPKKRRKPWTMCSIWQEL
ncbi:hypothetical protein O181_049525 [Austropuccinia psidii MF-1]|uniref:Uncharacterized protein n=1 Tax=Austropuccinia psidii MF-1 TaxID=1389203 RepID=A0A9Q3DZB7_9BASI|nr:hypothetical protein [Austropuccinia psidii MF-1]